MACTWGGTGLYKDFRLEETGLLIPLLEYNREQICQHLSLDYLRSSIDRYAVCSLRMYDVLRIIWILNFLSYCGTRGTNRRSSLEVGDSSCCGASGLGGMLRRNASSSSNSRAHKMLFHVPTIWFLCSLSYFLLLQFPRHIYFIHPH